MSAGSRSSGNAASKGRRNSPPRGSPKAPRPTGPGAVHGTPRSLRTRTQAMNGAPPGRGGPPHGGRGRGGAEERDPDISFAGHSKMVKKNVSV